MPFTPFHLGPGLLLEAAGGRHLSFLVFGFSQVAMDLEVGVRILRGDRVLHGFSHTYLGATLIGAASVLLGRPVCQRFLDALVPPVAPAWQAALRGPPRISWTAAAVGSFAGTWSHVALDSLMHGDLRPFAPWSGWNPWLGAVSRAMLHLGCLAAGAAGFLLWGGIALAAAARRARSAA